MNTDDMRDERRFSSVGNPMMQVIAYKIALHKAADEIDALRARVKELELSHFVGEHCECGDVGFYVVPDAEDSVSDLLDIIEADELRILDPNFHSGSIIQSKNFNDTTLERATAAMVKSGLQYGTAGGV